MIDLDSLAEFDCQCDSKLKKRYLVVYREKGIHKPWRLYRRVPHRVLACKIAHNLLKSNPKKEFEIWVEITIVEKIKKVE